MLKKASALLVLLLSTFTNLVFSETYSYEIEEIESLEISAGVEFTVWCGDVNKLEIFADSENDFQMSLGDKNLKLKGRAESNWLFFSWGIHDVTASITLKNPPKSIKLSAASEGSMQNCFKRESDLSLSASSASSFKIDRGSGSINHLEVDLSSAAEIEIEGKLHINHLTINASSASDFESDNEVIIETSKVRISSGSSVDICGVLEISGHVSSAGSIDVDENTIITNFRASSGGEVVVDC